MLAHTALALLLVSAARSAIVPAPGSAAGAYALLERISPGASSAFDLALNASCPTAAACFTLSDGPGGVVAIAGTNAGELTAGLGLYLREFVNATVGWPRGGGSRLPRPAAWPRVGAPVSRSRVGPWSFAMNVCVHSYTLVWHSWAQWEALLDWSALNGINLLYALTGQEEVQWKAFTALGAMDLETRAWFNGPAFLTWSRGQNSHGSSIGGPLPRSWMRAQWDLQLRILARERELGILPILPAFQGNVPWPLVEALGDTANATRVNASYGTVATGWMDSLDPVGAFDRVADAWMKNLCADFGCGGEGGLYSQWYQFDAFFAAGDNWGAVDNLGAVDAVPPAAPAACSWSAAQAGYLDKCAGGAKAPCPSAVALSAAQAACDADAGCGGVTLVPSNGGVFELRAGTSPLPSPRNETCWVCSRARAPDAMWLKRGAAAYGAVARADRAAVWGWQGWALNIMQRLDGYNEVLSAAELRGFADAANGSFVQFDMTVTGTPAEFETYALADVPFIHCPLYTFGGNIALKGDVAALNAAVPWSSVNASGFRGVGWVPEGFDQNAVVFELVAESSFHTGPLPDSTAWLVDRAHRRYGLTVRNADVAAAWTALAASVYGSATVKVTHDMTGVALMDAVIDPNFWHASASAPAAALCSVWTAWGSLLAAAPSIPNASFTEPYVYDLVNTGREALAQLATPLAVAFARTTRAAAINATAVREAGGAYVALLRALDTLLSTDAAFLLGPWLASARSWGINATSGEPFDDCGESIRGRNISCADFYEWNARAQLTTWLPPTSAAPVIGKKATEINDYARKHWAGLVGSYYAPRVEAVLAAALEAAPGPLTPAARAVAVAAFQHQWVEATGGGFPLAPVGDPVAVSAALRANYAQEFSACS